MMKFAAILALPLCALGLSGPAQAQTYSRTDVIVYNDNLTHWVIGQTASSTNVNAGLVEFSATYDPATALPTQMFAFGRLIRSMTYNPDGTLATIKDGNNNITTLSGWKRGIPQAIKYPATPESPTGAMVSAAVDDNGWIRLITDENGAGFTTAYDYDGMGRLKTIDYPDADTVAWPNTLISFAAVPGIEYGIPGNHWKQTATTGNATKITYFDALWRPLVEESYDAGNAAATRSVTVKRYDIGGHLAFQSYPRASIVSYTDASLTGTTTTYDALDRVKTVQQASEIGLLTTTMAYINGRATSVLNPRAKTTTTAYKAYDQPSSDWPVDITHPEGAFTHIDRDVFGKPTLISRHNSGSTEISNRYFAYYSDQQLCKTSEPETGSTAMGYDNAGNLVWSAAGLTLSTSNTCGYDASHPEVAANRVTRTYDARNRLKTIAFKDGRGDQAWNYTPDSLPSQITTINEAGTSAINSYGYNKRRLLIGETLQQTDFADAWTLGYGYSPQAALSSVTYPSGLSVSYAPNALGQATRAGTYATGVTYYPNGAIAGFVYGNGIVHTMSQNDRQLPDRSVDGGGVLDDSYAYDQNGNVAAISDGLVGNRGDRTMSYDGLDRLKTADSAMFGGLATYTYDALDNLTRVQLPSRDQSPSRDHYYCYDLSQRLSNVKTDGCSGATVIGLGYDVRGNLANKNGMLFEFDYGNRLRDVPGKESYRYDAYGRRIKAQSAQGAIYSFYGQDGVLRYQRDERKAEAYDYVPLNGSLVARVTGQAVVVGTPVLTVPASSSSGNYAVQWTSVALATQYELQEDYNDGGWHAAYAGTGTSIALNDKPAGTYKYQARACRDAVCGSWSVTAVIGVNSPPGSAPTLTAPSTAPNGDYTVSWSAIATSTHYILEENDGSGWIEAYNGAGFSKTYDNKPAGTYSYRVKACNSNGCSAVSATAAVQSIHPPAVPTISAPTTSNTGSYTVSWTAVASATVYKLEEKIGAGVWALLPDSTATSKAFSDKADGSYSYRLRACNIAGCGAYSATVVVTVLTPPTALATITTPALSTTGTYTVTWTAVAKATSYTLQRSANGGTWETVYTGANPSFSVTGQAQGGYDYRVQGCNAVGCGGWSATATTVVQFVPAAPTTLGGFLEKEMLPTGPKCSIVINWSSSAGADRYVLKNQTATMYDGPNRNFIKATYACGTYQVWVQACNAAGCSVWFGPYNVPTQIVGGGGA